jgi:hypothetical protein
MPPKHGVIQVDELLRKTTIYAKIALIKENSRDDTPEPRCEYTNFIINPFSPNTCEKIGNIITNYNQCERIRNGACHHLPSREVI